MTFHKLLCPVDFSPGSSHAMRAAIRIANDADAELVLAHVWHVPAIAYSEYSLAPETIQGISDDAERCLAAALAEATALGAKRVSTRLLAGSPWNALVGMLDDPSFDLVVIGTHGRTGLARILLGSVAENVIRHSPCSVIAIRPDAAIPETFTNILCPVDFSAGSRCATDAVLTLVRPHTRITLLHVIEPPISYMGEPPPQLSRDLEAAASTVLDHWATKLRALVSVSITTRSCVGYAGAETLAALDGTPKFDLVVMGSHGRTGLSRVVLGSVAEKVVRHANCPVLVARART